MNATTIITPASDVAGDKKPILEKEGVFARRHDLDALRAAAMLLGIVLHAALSFAPIPWIVNDSVKSDLFYVVFSAIHGFRMPLFFMLSGFFTAMLWRKRGLKSLLLHRLRRILLPLVVCCFTILPTMWVVLTIVTQPSESGSSDEQAWSAAATGDIEQLRTQLEQPGFDVDAINPQTGSTLLNSAVFLGQHAVVELLVDNGADVNKPNADQATALHLAAFMGRSDTAELLLAAGSDRNATDGNGSTPADNLSVDFGTTAFIAGQFGIAVEEETLMAGRAEIAEQLNVGEGFANDDGSAAALKGLYGLFFKLPVLMHLWFLAFLCWLVVAFMLYVPIANLLSFGKWPKWLVASQASLLWLVPLTAFAQSTMSLGSVGPDTSDGLLPLPHVLAYYAIFFFFGALYWDIDDRAGQLGRYWFVSLPVALFVVFPVLLGLVSSDPDLLAMVEDSTARLVLTNVLQALFVWMMTFGCIGLCRKLLPRENKTIRYLSDSSYWLYIAHLPLVFLGQWLVRDWQLPAVVKFALIVTVVIALLLVSYRYLVRYTFIGRLLNGPRGRPNSDPVSPQPAV